MPVSPPTPSAPAAAARSTAAFHVHLEVFSGPFDLLLQLIAKHQLDVTTVALAQVTDEFLAHVRQAGRFDLNAASEFLVVAATLLDLKAARLLPAAEEEAQEDLEILEARDLLFARLLQYRAFKEAAAVLSSALDTAQGWIPRNVPVDPSLAAALPEVLLGVDAERFAHLAARVLTPRLPPAVAVDHLHIPRVNIAEHVAVLVERLQALGEATFAELCSDCVEIIEMVARFLAALELIRDDLIGVLQPVALSELTLRWRGRQGASDRHLPAGADRW